MAVYPQYNPYSYGQQMNPYDAQMRSNNFQMQQPQQYIPTQYNQQVVPQNNFFKVVESIEAVNVADIPIDGNPYYFIKPDGSAIYSKRWLPNCSTTKIVTYLPLEEQQEVVNKNDILLSDEVMNRFNSIEEKIDGLSKMFSTNNKPVAKNKKEDVQQ